MIKKVIKKSENKNHNHNQKNITELKPDGNWNKPPISNSSQHYKTHHHHQQHHQKQQSSSQQQQQQQQQQNPSQNYHNFNNNQNHQHQQHHQQQLLKSRVRDSLSSERSSSCPNSSTTNSDGNNSGIVDFGNIDDDDDSDSTLSTDSSEYNIDDDDDDDSDTSNNTNNEHHDNGEKETLDPISEEISSMKKKSSDNNNDDDDDENDDSTCCDEDFTWVCSETSVEPSQQKKPSLSSNSPTAIINNNNNNNTISTLNTIGKPPQRPLGSLDRKRHQNHANRRDRDQKSKSAHSLRDKNILNDTKDSYNHRLIIPKHQQHDNNNFYNESSSSYTNLRCKRGSPTAYWEPPPPPPLPYPGYDFHPYWGGYSSREDLRMQQQQHHDYYNNKRHEFCHYGSTNTLPVLSSSQEFFSNSPCCGGVGGGGCRYPPNYCLCNHKNSSMWNLNQRPDVDERLRRYQTEKESLIVQVQVLTDQLSAQNTKIIELEKSLTEKTQLLNSTEDMLQREMLSRSSLETQKLELMSAMSELKLQQAALERENLELRASQSNNNSLSRRLPIVNSQRFLSSTPQQQHQQQQDITVNNTSFHGSIGSLQPQINLSTPNAPKTPPASFRHQVNPHFSSLPRTSFSSTFSTTTQQKQHKSNENGLENSINLMDNNANLKQRNVAFAENEKVIDEFNTLELQRNHTPQQSGTSPSLSQKSKGLRSIFGKIKRSNSGNLEDLPGDGEFKRGGIRATAGARLGWSQNLKPNKPFKEWNIDEICAWFDEMGLGCYEDDLKKWITNGSDLIDASPIDIERELNLKSQLHRKKIILAIRELSEKETDEMTLNAGKLDTSWVMRWLDDIGLPQHKDAFSITRLDGRMLHKLTMDDLTSLHITSCLHVASLRRGIQIMRENNWNPDCLIRRSSSENSENEQVALWTAHRVMEWLRVVDLAEYAPNLRGAGVHGALMIYETRFTADLLADLLSIPPSKTLLRRHLATHFKELLGRDVIQGKRDAENTLGYQPLTITSKIKTPKKSQFSLKRRKSTKGGDEWSDFVCPMGPSDDEATESRHHNRLRTCLSSN